MVFQILSTALMLLLVMDPGGNLPLFVSLLRKESPVRYRQVVIRESLIALAVLFLFLCFGESILKLLQVSKPSLGIGGAVILFLISLKMVFGAPVMYSDHNGEKREFLIVPLAIPLIAGPSAITMIILVRSSQPILVGATALLLAWGGTTLILLIGRWLARLLGKHVLEAVESLMGFLLAIIAVEMFVKGILNIFS